MPQPKRKDRPLQVRAIPVPSSAKHPEPPNDVLPRHEFSIGIIAPKGSGKTTIICNLLCFYRKYFHTIIIFSPTVASDEKWDYIKNQDLLAENIPLKKWLRDRANRREFKDRIVQPPPVSHELEGLVHLNTGTNEGKKGEKFDGRIPEDCFYTQYNEADLQSILHQQKAIITELKKHHKTKHLANRILFIFDDLVGSALFSRAGDNPFKMMNTNHRHYSLSIMMVTQAYKELPRTVRVQFSCVILFEIPNEKEIDVVYEENPVGLAHDPWMEMYRHAIDGDHNFLFINFQKPKRLRCMKNFDTVLFFQ